MTRPTWVRRCLVATASIALVAGSVVGAGAPAFASATASASEAPATDGKEIFRIATSGFVDSFNPFTSIYLLPTNSIRYMYESLVQNDAKDGSPTAGLAEKWEASPDGMKWTFTLHKDMKWSDNEPITSKDVKWTYDQMMTVPAMGTANGNLVSNFKSIDTPDDTTLVINLKTPQAPNPGTEIPVVPEHIWSKIADPTTFLNDKDAVGSGPFVVKSYKANQSIELTANPNFWRGPAKIDGLQYIYYTNSDAQLQALRAGEVDFVSGLTATQFKALENEPNITTHAGEGRRFTNIGLNFGSVTPEGVEYGTGNPALKDKAVRAAMRQGIDVDSLLKQVLGDYGTPATSFIPSAFARWHLPNEDSAIVKFDVEAAKKTLEDAGWTPGADGIREKDGKKIELRLLVDASSSNEQSMADYLVPWMKEIGITIKVESTDSDTISDKTTKGDYDLYFSGWSVNPDPDYQLGINTCASRPDAEGNGATTQDGYCNPEFDKKFAEQHSELDPEKRATIVHDMLRMHYTDVAQITLWYPNSLEAYRSDKFSGFTLQPEENGIIANQAGYWGFLTVDSVQADAATESKSGPGTGLWIGLGAAAIVIIGGVAFAVNRRKNSAERE